MEKDVFFIETKLTSINKGPIEAQMSPTYFQDQKVLVGGDAKNGRGI